MFVECLGFGDKRGLSDVLMPGAMFRFQARQRRQQVLRVDHADDVVGRTVVHEQTSVIAAAKGFEHVGARIAEGYRIEVESRRHDLRHGGGGERKHPG